MTGFTTRVVLDRATAADLARLNAEMTREGFSMVITANDGSTYELPPGEYVYEYNPMVPILREQVRDKAARAAQRVSGSFAVIVSVSISWAWCGLRECGNAQVRPSRADIA